MNFIANILQHYQFPKNDIDNIQNFNSRDGFCLLEKQEFDEMMAYFSEFPDVYGDSIPIITDNNSNYICVYIDGEFKHQVWYLSHDDPNTKPRFNNISELVELINTHSDCWDFDDLADKMGIDIYDD